MSFTIEEQKLNLELQVEYVLWFGKKFRLLPKSQQHTLLENLCEWGFGESPLGSNPLYLQDSNKAFTEYTRVLCDEKFFNYLPKKIQNKFGIY